VYAFIMGWPEKEAVVRALGTQSPQSPARIRNVELLGHAGRLSWNQEANGLRVKFPDEKFSEEAVALKIAFA
jgi:alpha-L-fucosidase